MTEDVMVGWHHRFNGHEVEQAPVNGEGQGTLACCSPWGCKEWDMNEHAAHYSRISIVLLESGLGIIININCRL